MEKTCTDTVFNLEHTPWPGLHVVNFNLPVTMFHVYCCLPWNEIECISLCSKVTDKTDPFYIDGQDEKQSNWLRYVNCARTKQEQNCEAFQYKGQIYYKALRNIGIGG